MSSDSSVHDFKSVDKTLLGTDIKGSTPLWDALRKSMAPILEKHHGLIIGICKNHGGIIFADTGDGIFANFDSSTEALLAALEIQQEVQSQDWGEAGNLQLYTAIHSGEVYLQPLVEDLTKLRGPSINLLARLLAAANPGQILVSDTTRDIQRGALPNGMTLDLLGRFTFKGVQSSHVVYQLNHPTLPDSYPPVKAPPAFSLPESVSFGRKALIAELKEKLQADGTRLLTLHGEYGVGKTNLALTLAGSQISRFEGGVLFVPLAEFERDADISAVVESIAAKIGGFGHTTLDGLANSLKDRRLLLILDNCEHVLDVCNTLCRALLQNCPAVKILATSREKIGLKNEKVHSVPPFDVNFTAAAPTTGEAGQAEGAGAENDAVQVFLHYVSLKDSRFQPTPASLREIEAVCRQVEGNALSIRLVASLVVVDSTNPNKNNLRQLSLGLRNPLKLLKSSNLDEEVRHGSVTAAIQFSFDHLTKVQQRVFKTISVLNGKWSSSMARALCQPALKEEAMEQVLGELRSKTLIHYEHSSQPDSLETFYGSRHLIRAFGESLLKPAEKERLHRRAAELFADDLKRYTETYSEQSEKFTSLAQAFMFDDDRWIAIRREWLYHSTYETDRAVARLQFIQMFLFAFWWWDELDPYPFNEEILERWEKTQTLPDDQAFAAALRDFRNAYPRKRGWRERPGNPAWRQAQSALRRIRKHLRQDRRASQAGGKHRMMQETVMALLACYTGEYYHLAPSSKSAAAAGDAARFARTAMRCFRLASRRFQAREEMQWSVPYVATAITDLYAASGQFQKGLDICASALETAEEDEDFEALAWLWLSAANALYSRGAKLPAADSAGFEAAFACYRMAVWNGFLFQAFPHPPDTYTLALYAVALDQSVDKLLSNASQTREPDRLVARVQEAHRFWKADAEGSELFASDALDAVVRGWFGSSSQPPDAAAIKAYIAPLPPIIRFSKETGFSEETDAERAEYARQVTEILTAIPADEREALRACALASLHAEEGSHESGA